MKSRTQSGSTGQAETNKEGALTSGARADPRPGQRSDAPGDLLLAKAKPPTGAGVSILLAALPIFSFLGQYLFSLGSGTERIMIRHLIVTAVDWIFVPFNYFVFGVINWSRGGRLFFLFCLSTILTVATHAYWQQNGLDLGHMMTKAGVVLPAGWVHLVFSILEMALLTAFVFCRNEAGPGLRRATTFAVAYFLALAICGYIMHHGVIASDALASASGLFFVLVYPRLAKAQRADVPIDSAGRDHEGR